MKAVFVKSVVIFGLAQMLIAGATAFALPNDGGPVVNVEIRGQERVLSDVVVAVGEPIINWLGSGMNYSEHYSCKFNVVRQVLKQTWLVDGTGHIIPGSLAMVKLRVSETHNESLSGTILYEDPSAKADCAQAQERFKLQIVPEGEALSSMSDGIKALASLGGSQDRRPAVSDRQRKPVQTPKIWVETERALGASASSAR